MSCGLQRDCASANTGRMRSGVATYRIRSRQLFRIQRFGRDRAAGTAGTVCGREKAVTCCMWKSALIIPPEAVKINVRRILSRLRRRANVVAAAMKRGTHAVEYQ